MQHREEASISRMHCPFRKKVNKLRTCKPKDLKLRVLAVVLTVSPMQADCLTLGPAGELVPNATEVSKGFHEVWWGCAGLSWAS